MSANTPAQVGVVARLAARHMDLHTLSPDCRGGCEAVVPAADYDRLAHRVEQLEAALRALVSVIDKAGGPLRLSGAVQLGSVSWCVKANDAMDAARAALSGVSP